MALRLLVAHTPAERDAARRVEAQVFLQAFGNTPEVMEQEYGPYEERSRFVTVIDEVGGSALGTARLILPDDAGTVKTLTDVAGEPWHLDVAVALRAAGLSGRPVWDVASLAVDRRYRSGASGAEVSLALCHGIWQYSRNCGVHGLVTILDDRVLRLVQVMGLPWNPMAGATSRYYLGSPASTPCDFRVGSAADSVRARRPDLLPALFDGTFRSIALDPADLLPGRGGSLPRAAPPEQPDRPSVARRDTSGWRSPAHRRTATLVSSPQPRT
jgi:hypothetical protein